MTRPVELPYETPKRRPRVSTTVASFVERWAVRSGLLVVAIVIVWYVVVGRAMTPSERDVEAGSPLCGGYVLGGRYILQEPAVLAWRARDEKAIAGLAPMNDAAQAAAYATPDERTLPTGATARRFVPAGTPVTVTRVQVRNNITHSVVTVFGKVDGEQREAYLESLSRRTANSLWEHDPSRLRPAQ